MTRCVRFSDRLAGALSAAALVAIGCAAPQPPQPAVQAAASTPAARTGTPQLAQSGASASPDAATVHAAWTGAGEWLIANQIPRAPGLVWAADPRDPSTVSAGLYSGYSGVVLFLLEGWTENHDPRWLAAARGGADSLAAAVETEDDPGLYTGLTGMAFVLERAAEVTGEDRYRSAARRAIGRVIALAHPIGAGVDWGPPVPDDDDPPSNDVVSGSAGIGLGLLWAEYALGMPQAGATAERAGRRLLEVALPAPPDGRGRKWLLAPGMDRVYPNFAHGTAGVAYFLASLYQDRHAGHEPAADGTAESGSVRDFLDAAVAGARYLQTIATPVGNGCLIFRHEPDARDLFYYSWCHGPAGTARLFHRLHEITGEAEWRDWVDRLARGVLASGVPEQKQPGFWNVSQCCGSAGVAEFALTMYQITGRTEYLDLAHRMTADLVARATRDGSGWSWIQAENRTDPDTVVAQTGLMQGAAGIGLWFLRLERFERDRPERASPLPDSPF